MRKLISGISALIIGASAANAAFLVNLQGSAAPGTLETTFTYSDLDGTPTFNGGTLDASTVVITNDISGASGSFTVTWTATDRNDPTNAVPSEWTFGTNANLYAFGGNAWGIQSGVYTTLEEGGWRQFSPGEAFLLSFNTDNLTLDPGKVLVFSAIPTDGDGFEVYQRNGTSSGVLITTLNTSTPAAFSGFTQVEPIEVPNGTHEFAITSFPGFGRIVEFKVDVIDAIVGVQTPTGLDGLPIDSGVVLEWEADPTAFLDYYTVYRSTVSGTNNYASITNVFTPIYVDSGLINGTNYYYSVKAVGTNGTPEVSDFSEEFVIAPIEKATNTVLLMNYDASVSSSVALSNDVNNSTMVVAWTNQVGTGGSYVGLATVPGALYPSADLSASGLPGIDFTEIPSRLRLAGALQSDNILNTTSNSSGFVVMVAVRPEGDEVTGDQQDIIGNSTSTSQGFGIRWTGDRFQTWLADNIYVDTAATTGDTVVVSFRYDARTFEATAWESASGNSTTESRLPLDYSLDTGVFNLGYITSTNRQFRGQIFEVKVWGTTLDDATLESERNEMMVKWVGTDAGYNSWTTQWEGVDLGAGTDDFDNDGLDNLYEYGLGGNPTNFTQAPAVLPVLMNTGSGFNYVHVQRNNDPGLAYTVETTTDLVNIPFTNMGYTVSGTNVGDGVFNTVTNAVDSLVDERFIRLIIEN